MELGVGVEVKAGVWNWGSELKSELGFLKSELAFRVGIGGWGWRDRSWRGKAEAWNWAQCWQLGLDQYWSLELGSAFSELGFRVGVRVRS